MIKKIKDLLNSYDDEDLDKIGLYVDNGKEISFMILDENDDIILITENVPISIAGHNIVDD